MAKETDDSVIHFTPEQGFIIESLARTIVQAMRDMDMDAQVNLPDGTAMDIQKSCTAKEIVDGYNEFIKKQVSARIPSNKNEQNK